MWQRENTKMADLNPKILIITLNVSGQKAQIKRQRLDCQDE